MTKLLAVVALLVCSVSAFAQLKVIMSGGFSAPYNELLPEFERNTGVTVTTVRGPSQGDSPNTIGAQLRRGVVADMVIMSKEGLEPLLAEGRAVRGTSVDLAQVPLGVAVRAGAPRPDISSVEAFKQTLLKAESIGVQSTTAIYMTTKLLPQLGIADTVASKLTGAGAAAVARGESEMAVLPISELMHVPGADYIGTIPAEIQHISVFTAALLTNSQQPESSKRLIAFLSSDLATAPIRKFGMEPIMTAPKR